MTRLPILFAFASALSLSVRAAEPDAVVRVSLKAPGYTAANAPQFARVKFNKAAPLCMISDDMSLGDFCSTWALFNGYPHSATTQDRKYARGDLLLDEAVRGVPAGFYDGDSDLDGVADGVHDPLVFSDGAGGFRRFACSSAVFAYSDGNYLQITPEDVRTMMRTGWSCTFHDVNDCDTGDAESIAARFAPISERWAARTGQPLKIMTEPNGNHVYLDACRMSDEICWSIFQNSAAGYPANSILIDDWTNRAAGIPSSFESKPQGGFARIWAQGSEASFSNAVNAVISSGVGTKFILGGTHGVSQEFKRFFRNEIRASDLFWVASVDEIWEYYWLYHHASIENLAYDPATQTLAFDVRLPASPKHRFREVTVNLPGLAGASDFAFEGAITANAAQNADGATINVGVEEHVLADAGELLDLRDQYVANPCLDRDARYLVGLLAPGPAKDAFEARLATEWKYSWAVKTHLGDTLFDGRCNEPTNVSYAVPLFFLHGTDLYRLDPDRYPGKWLPYCGGSFSLDDTTPTFATNWLYRLNEGYGIGWNSVVLYAEGEDLLPEARVDDSATMGVSMQATALPSPGADVPLGRLGPGRYKFCYKYVRPSGTAHSTWAVVTNGAVAWSASNTKNESSTTILSSEFELLRGADAAFRVTPNSGSLCELADCVWIKRTGDVDTSPALGAVSAAAGATAATLSVRVDSLGAGASTAELAVSLGGATQTLALSGTGTFEFDFPGLVPDTDYGWTVSLVSDGGTDAASGTVRTESSRPTIAAEAAARRILGAHSVAVSVTLSDFGPGAAAAELTVALGGETQTRSVSATGTFEFVFDGLDPGTAYAWTATAGNGLGTASQSGTATTRSPAVALTAPAAAVGDGGTNATLSVSLALDAAAASVVLLVDGRTNEVFSASASGTIARTVAVRAGAAHTFAFAAAADGETSSAAGSFVAWLLSDWFRVRWTADGYPTGSGWDSDPAAQARSGGTWTRPAGDASSLANDALSLAFAAPETDMLVFAPTNASAAGVDLVVEGVVDAHAGTVTEPSVTPVAGLAFGADGPLGWTAAGPTPLDGAPDATAGLAWRIEFDFSSADAPRVRYSLGGSVLTAGGVEWLPLDPSVDSVRRVAFTGAGSLADFRGVQRALVSEPVEIPPPVLRSGEAGSALLFPDAATFSISLVDTDAGFWYTAFAADTLDGPWVAEKNSDRGTGGPLTLSVDADPQAHPSRFVRIVVSREPCEAGTSLAAFLAR